MKLQLKKPTLELTKKPVSSPYKIQDGKYVQRALATTKMQKMAQNIA